MISFGSSSHSNCTLWEWREPYFKYQFYHKPLPDFFDIDDLPHTKECEDRITNGLSHDNCFCVCHDKGMYGGSNEPKE